MNLAEQCNYTARPFAGDHGVGMMTIRQISKGSILWFLPPDDPASDVLTKDYKLGGGYPDLDNMISDFECNEPSGKYTLLKREVPLTFDASALTNHSLTPNAMHVPVSIQGVSYRVMIALTDLSPGKEVFQNYYLTCWQGHKHTKEKKTDARHFSGYVEVKQRKRLITLNNNQFDNLLLRLDDIKPREPNPVSFPFALQELIGYDVWFYTQGDWEMGKIVKKARPNTNPEKTKKKT